VKDSLEIRLLGPLQVLSRGHPVTVTAPLRQVILAALALEAGQPVSSSTLARYLWGEDLRGDARRAVSTVVTRLRKDLGVDVIERTAGGYLLAVPADAVDVHHFRSLLESARSTDCASRLRQLNRALAFWRGEALQDLSSDRLVATYAPKLNEERYSATERRVDLLLAAGRHVDLVPQLRHLTTHEPLREGLWCRLIVALYRCGRQAEALEAYRAVHQLLADQLGIAPGPELTAAHHAVLTHDPTMAAPAVAWRSRPVRRRPRVRRIVRLRLSN
jgi:DNA-binding SARP family transcriptional activator